MSEKLGRQPPMIVSRIASALASWWTTAVILLTLAAAWFAFAVGPDPFPAWSAWLAHSPGGISLSGGLVLNLLAASLRIIRERFMQVRITPDRIRRMDNHVAVPAHGEETRRTIEHWMAELGFAGAVTRNGSELVRNRYAILPGTVARVGFIIFLAALVFSFSTRRQVSALLHEGEATALFGVPVALHSIRPAFTDDYLQIGDAAGEFSLENVSAVLRTDGLMLKITPTAVVRSRSLYFRIAHLGIAQQITAAAAGKSFARTVDLDILPPGRTDFIPLRPLDLFMSVSLEPERTIAKGYDAGKQYNLLQPSYRVILQSGVTGERVGQTVLRPGGHARLPDADVSFGDQAAYLRVEIVRDPALIWIRAGIAIFLLGALGMFSRLLWYEQRFAAIDTGTTILLGFSNEYFHKRRGMVRFDRWKADLNARLHPSEPAPRSARTCGTV